MRATIALAEKLRNAQPKLYRWALGMRDRNGVARLLDPVRPRPLLHTSSRIPAALRVAPLYAPPR